MNKDTGIKPVVLESIISQARNNNIERVVLFGSRARGDFRERSDIDIAVYGGNAARFALDIDESAPTLLFFDVVDMSKPVTDELRHSIENEGTIVYEEI